MYYVKAIGVNRWAGGTPNWIKIRSIKRIMNGYIIGIRMRGEDKYIFVSHREDPQFLKFGKGWPDLRPVSWKEVKNEFINVVETKKA